VGFCTLSVAAAGAGEWKLLGISWVAFAAMAGAIPLGVRAAADRRPYRLVWGFGLASGAMLTSAALFLLPQAFGLGDRLGGLGVAIGILAGFAAHTVGHQLTHANSTFDHAVLELSAHALAAGVIIGAIYAALPELGPLLGVAIVSHKGPAGYAAARRLASEGRSAAILLVPAAGVGLTALPVALLGLPTGEAANGIIFGFAAGVFLHVALDFLPRCEIGSDVYELAHESADAHQLLDRLRLHAVLSTLLGAVLVVVAWQLVA
jgi:ZIP family zinc transporter